MRKFVVLLLTLAMMLAVLPGVAQEEMAGVDCMVEEDVTLAVGVSPVGIDRELTQHAIDRFTEECPNYTFELIETPESASDYLGLLLQLFEAKSGDIDVFQIDVIWPGLLSDHLLDLSEYVTEEEIEAHFPAIVENNTVEGRLVGLPFFTDAGMFYYRTDLLEKYELDVPQTWEDLEAAAKTIQEGERAEGMNDFWGFVWQGDAYEGLTCDALEWQYSNGGGRIISPEGVVEVNNEATLEMFEMVAGWVGTISPEGVTTYREEDARSLWQSGNAAFMRNWPYAYNLGQQEDSVIKDMFGVSPLPAGEMGSAATLGGWQVAVNSYSKNTEAAVTFARFLAGPEIQKYRAIEGSMAPTIMDLYEDEEVLEAVPLFEDLYDVFINAVARPSAVAMDRYNEVSTLYFTTVHEILVGAQDADTALQLLELDLADLGFERAE